MKEEILGDAEKKMEEVLTEAVGRFEARKLTGLFFSSEILAIEGKSVAEYIYDITDNRARPYQNDPIQ